MNTFKISFFIIGLIFFGFIMISSSTIELNGKYTKCYDRRGNIIEGQKCIVQSSVNTRNEAYYFGILIGIFGLIVLTIFGYLMDEDDYSGRIK